MAKNAPAITVNAYDLVECADFGTTGLRWTHCAVGNVPSVGGGPTQDIYMEWHSIEIYDKRTDVLPRFQ